jgi:hypothetical protein
MKRKLKKTNKKIKNKRRTRVRRRIKRRTKKSMKGGTTPFSGLQNLFAECAYAAQTAISPLLDNTIDDKIINPNPAVQFQNAKMEQYMIAGPNLSINK